MATIGITGLMNVRGGNGSNGLLKKLYCTSSAEISGFKLVGADGKLANGIVGSVNEAEYIIYECGFNNKASSGDVLAVTDDVLLVVDTAQNIGTRVYLNNTSAGLAGEIVTNVTATTGDLKQVVGFYVPDKTAGATSTLVQLKIKPAVIV